MTSITIALDEAQAARLKQFADQQGQTVEQAIHTLIEASLEASASKPPLGSTLDLAGIIADASVPPLSARELDAVLADEVRDAHAAK